MYQLRADRRAGNFRIDVSSLDAVNYAPFQSTEFQFRSINLRDNKSSSRSFSILESEILLAGARLFFLHSRDRLDIQYFVVVETNQATCIIENYSNVILLSISLLVFTYSKLKENSYNSDPCTIMFYCVSSHIGTDIK